MRLHELRARAGERGSHRGAETLGKAHAHRVERSRELGHRSPTRGGRVPEPSAVEVHAKAERARTGRDLLYVLLREHAPARAVVRVLEGDQRGARVVVVGGLDGRLEIRGGEEAPL